MPFIKPPANRSLLTYGPIKAVGIIVGIALALGIVGHFDYEAAEADNDHYCDMVQLWKADAKAGIPANERRGWPPFKQNEVTCHVPR